jgi:hypothetical protein
MVSNEMAFNLLCGEILPSSAHQLMREREWSKVGTPANVKVHTKSR